MNYTKHPWMTLIFISIIIIFCMYIFINTFYKKYILNKELVNACRQKKFNNIIFFVKQGADINLVVNEFGDSILHVLAQNDQTDIYNELVHLGADQHLTNEYNHTARQIYEYKKLKVRF